MVTTAQLIQGNLELGHIAMEEMGIETSGTEP